MHRLLTAQILPDIVVSLAHYDDLVMFRELAMPGRRQRAADQFESDRMRVLL